MLKPLFGSGTSATTFRWWQIVIIRRAMSRQNAVPPLKTLFLRVVDSVQPATLIRNQVKIADGLLVVNSQSFPLPKSCYAIGFGKAVLGMAVALEQTLGDRLERAIMTVPVGIFRNYPEMLGKSRKILFIEGAENNIPDRKAVEGALKIKVLVEKLRKDDLLIVLISGGGSALLPLPKSPITLEEKQDIIKGLSRGGANIQELNTVRKQLSLLKGGGLAKLAYPAKVVSLILSDIVGDPIDLIASGPTVYSLDESQEAIEILKKYDLYESAPVTIKTVLETRYDYGGDGARVTNGQSSDHVSNFIIGTNRIATRAAKILALEMGWQCVLVSHKVEENVNFLAEIYAELAYHVINGRIVKIKKLLESLPFELEENAINETLSLYATKKILLIFAGEPTVLVTGTGKGGRNQQLALAFALHLHKLASESTNAGYVSLLSAGTDGIDGPTDAAGAVAYSGLKEDCIGLGFNPETYLKNNDSYTFFNAFRNGECLVKVGHTGTNVMDLHFLLIEPCTH